MFFSDDFFGFVTVIGVGIGGYFIGKTSGISETVEKYESQRIIQEQQRQISLLNEKLDKAKEASILDSSS